MVIRFMDFEDPPTAQEVDALGALLARSPGAAMDFGSLEMARVAARFYKESRSRWGSYDIYDRDTCIINIDMICII